ncbi:MAG TPA: AraC family transcriptional regulator [Bryobacteraceae bacterium]|nr:AraC family transcriptional regulator [Bryobacteraceae bacterium]
MKRPRSIDAITVWRAVDFPDIVFHQGAGVTRTHPKHWHDEVHVCLYSAGYGSLRHAGRSRRVGAGDLVVTAPGEVHENWVEDGAGVSFAAAYFDPSVFDRAMGRAARPHMSGIDVLPPGPAVRTSFLRLSRAMQSSDASLLARDEALMLFCHRLLARRSLPPSHLTERLPVVRVREFIEANFAQPLSLEQLATIAGLSAFHLHRMFRQQVSMPPHAWQTQVRVNHAKRLLRRGMPPSQVALEVGFADQSHLHRHFQRLVGVTPGLYSRARLRRG